MRIEILHTDDCPNWAEAGNLVSRALSDLGIPGTPVEFTLTSTPEQAAARPFSGSPTILIDGTDPFPTNGATSELACRVYPVDGHFAGTGSVGTSRLMNCGIFVARSPRLHGKPPPRPDVGCRSLS